MKAMSKSELAESAGVSLSTLRRWCNTCNDELVAMGWKPQMKVLPPRIAKFLADRFCIDVGT